MLLELLKNDYKRPRVGCNEFWMFKFAYKTAFLSKNDDLNLRPSAKSADIEIHPQISQIYAD